MPISIGFPSPTDSILSSFDQDSISGRGNTCAYPCWPSGDRLTTSWGSSAPSSFISDADLFPEDLDEASPGPYLHEAPEPPRQIPLAGPLPLPPLYAQAKPKKQRRRSSRKLKHPTKPMTPISESPETPE